MGVLPYSLYVRFLITKGVDTVDEVNEHLKELDMHPCPKPAFRKQFDIVQDNLPPAILKQIEVGSYTPEFIRWMKVIEVEDLWYLEKPFRDREKSHLKLAVDINYDPELRLTLQALLLKNKNYSEVHQEIVAKFSAMLKPIHLELYQRFFWNVEMMTRKAWKAYLRNCEAREQSIIFAAMTEPRTTVKALLDLPTNIDLSKTLQYLLVQSYQKAKTYLQIDSPSSDAQALKWIDATIKLADKYDKHATGDVADFGKTLQMEFEFIDDAFPTPDAQTLADLQQEAKDRKEQEKKTRKAEDAEE